VPKASGKGFTVSMVLPVMFVKAAEIVVIPVETPTANPAALIVATPLSDEVHVVWLLMSCVLPSE
jgi:hypothetical protein